MAIGQRLRPPSAQHLLGTDEIGRDLLARIIHGSRNGLRVGLISVAIGGLVGTALGLVAGLGSRKVDLAIGGLVDVMLAFPGFLLALAILATLGTEPRERDDRHRDAPRARVRPGRSRRRAVAPHERVRARRPRARRGPHCACRPATCCRTSPRR